MMVKLVGFPVLRSHLSTAPLSPPSAQDDCAPCYGTGQYADETCLSACKTAPAGKTPTSSRQGLEGCELGSAYSGA